MNRILWPTGTLHVENGEIVPAAGKPRSPSGITRIYLLVHGFNNDRTQAQTSYHAFRERLIDVIGPYLAQRIWEFYWPGYEDAIAESLRQYLIPRLMNTGYTAVRYYKQVPKAIRFGRMLGEYLSQLSVDSRPAEIVMIGHSLGCRLILEALAEMNSRSTKSSVPAILLMAGAVPTQHLESGGQLRAAAQSAPRRIALYSARDTVLRCAFPGGQVLARDGGFRPEAAGLNGRPRDCWTGRDQTMLRHGEYWSAKSTTPNIVRLFGKSTPHVLPYSDILPRSLPDPVALPEWRSPERRVSP